MNVTVNEEQKLFVITSAGGYTCFGFENCFREAKALAQRLGVNELKPTAEQIGKLEQYENYIKLLGMLRESGRDLGTWFDPRTVEPVRRILEDARIRGIKLRIFLGDHETGNDWMEEHDALGRIGQSTGFLKVPLIIENQSDCGGPAILDASIVRIIDATSKRELYRHPTYRMAKLEIAPSGDDKLPYQVTADGEFHARFKTMTKAQNWVAFMEGTRMSM